MPGCGKSTVGRQVARHIGWRFVDCDTEVTRLIGVPIRVFFETHGEARFREVEEQVIASLSSERDTVIATGGGVVTRPANRAVLRANTIVVYLRSSPEELWRRLRHDTRRPLLQVADPMHRLRELYRDRDALYRETAHHIVDTGRGSVPGLANRVLMQLEMAGVIDPFRGAAGGPPTSDT